MMPESSELKVLDDAIATFGTVCNELSRQGQLNGVLETAAVDMIQAVNRIRLIYGIKKVKDVKVSHQTVPKPISGAPKPGKPPVTEMTGSFCIKCFGTNLRIKGAGCIMCLTCGFDLGC